MKLCGPCPIHDAATRRFSPALGSCAFATAFIGAGAILSLVGTRPLFLIAGAGVLLVWAVPGPMLRGAGREPLEEPGKAVAAPTPVGTRAAD